MDTWHRWAGFMLGALTLTALAHHRRVRRLEQWQAAIEESAARALGAMGMV